MSRIIGGQSVSSSFRFHHVSTDEVFGSLPKDTQIKFTENTPYDQEGHTQPKAAAGHLVQTWWKPLVTCLITNC